MKTQTADSPPPAAAQATTAEPAVAIRPPKTKAKSVKPSGKKAAAKKVASTPAAKPAAKQPAKTTKPAKPEPAKGLSAMGAAHAVLAASKEPMTVKAIIAEMSKQGLWESPGGRTPHSTLAAAIGRDINAKGRESKFKKADRGLFIASGR